MSTQASQHQRMSLMLTVACVFILVTIDQVAKYWIRLTLQVGETHAFIPYLVELFHVQNVGAAFGLGAGGRIFFIVFALLICALCVSLYMKCEEMTCFEWVLLVLLSAGAMGNLIDRVLFGQVTDFFNLMFVEFAVFNVADIYVSLTAVLFISALLLRPLSVRHLMVYPDSHISLFSDRAHDHKSFR